MNIPAIGNLTPHPQIQKWLRSEPIEVPFFKNQKLQFVLADFKDSDEEEINSAVVAFLRLGETDREKAAVHVYRNYEDMKGAVSEEDLGCTINSPNEVWGFVHPKDIYVTRRRYKNKEMYVQLTAECDWELEHGLQIIFRKGSVLSRVSAQDGHLTYSDAYAVPEEQDRIS